MDSMPIPTYQDLDVHTEWVHEAADDTLIVYLPGFKKEQLKVQLTSVGKLRISGQRPVGLNKFNRFSKEFTIPSNSDQNKIKANFTSGMLHVKLPKLIVPVENPEEEEEKPSAQVLKADQKPAPQPPTPRPADASPQKQKNGPEQAVVQEAPPKATVEKETGEKKDGVAKQADDVSSKAPDKAKEMKDEKSAGNGSDEKVVKKEEKGSDQEEKGTTSDEEKAATRNEKHEKLGDSFQDAAEKENTEPKILDRDNKYYQIGITYKQILDDLLRRLKNPRKVMNKVLVVLLVVVLAVYIRNAIRSLGLCNDDKN